MKAERTIEGEESTVDECLIAALRGRSAFYRLLSQLFSKPLTQQQIDSMQETDLQAWSGINGEMDKGINDMIRSLRKRNTGTREELAVDYTGAFGGTKTISGKNAVPFESVFTSPNGLLCQESFHQVHDMFRKAGFRKHADDSTPDDHLGYICEFMAILSDQAAEAVAAGDAKRALAELRLSQSCLKQHVLSWYGQLRDRAQQLIETRFYRGVLCLAGGYFTFDDESLEEMIAMFE